MKAREEAKNECTNERMKEQEVRLWSKIHQLNSVPPVHHSILENKINQTNYSYIYLDKFATKPIFTQASAPLSIHYPCTHVIPGCKERKWLYVLLSQIVSALYLNFWTYISNNNNKNEDDDQKKKKKEEEKS